MFRGRRFAHFAVALGAAVGIAGTVGAATASQALAGFGPVHIVNANGPGGRGRCLDGNAPTAGQNGSRVQLWDCQRRAVQLWFLNFIGNTQAGAPLYQIQNSAHGLCLDANGGRGAAVKLWKCNGRFTQAWEVPNGIKINSHPDFIDHFNPFTVLDGRAPGHNGSAVQLWTANGRPIQQWTLQFP